MKLTLDALQSRAEAVASNDLLATITGGVENACHPTTTVSNPKDNGSGMTPLTGNPVIDPFIGLANLIKLIL